MSRYNYIDEQGCSSAPLTIEELRGLNLPSECSLINTDTGKPTTWGKLRSGEGSIILDIPNTEMKATMVKCPFCKEEIQEGAIKCKHCGEVLNKNAYVGTNTSPTKPAHEVGLH